MVGVPSGTIDMLITDSPTSNTQRCLAAAHCIDTARSRSTPKKVSAEDATSEDARSPGNSTNLPPRYYKCYMSRSRYVVVASSRTWRIKSGNLMVGMGTIFLFQFRLR